jgi:hypothetical protein
MPILTEELIHNRLSDFRSQEDHYSEVVRLVEEAQQRKEVVHVFEYGSGYNTYRIQKLLRPSDFLYSVESNLGFEVPKYPFCKGTYTHKIIPAQQPYGKSQNYTTYALDVACTNNIVFDVVVVAGRNRADCLCIAALVLAPDGVAVLHNSERDCYKTVFHWFKSREEVRGRSALFRRPIISYAQTEPLETAFYKNEEGEIKGVEPPKESIPLLSRSEAKEMPFTARRWGVCSVAILRENVAFMDSWVSHHVKAGASRIIIYDNSGSEKSLRPKTIFSEGFFQKAGTSKRGERYNELTKKYTDEEILAQAKKIAEKYSVDGCKVEIKEWKPRDTDGKIYHGQVEAYVDFIKTVKDELDWALFFDQDEYVYMKPGLKMDKIIQQFESEHLEGVQIRPWRFEMRWGKDGANDFNAPHMLRHKQFSAFGADKTFVNLHAVLAANIHIEWHFLNGNKYVRFADMEDFGFSHYNHKPEWMGQAIRKIHPFSFFYAPAHPSMSVKLSPPIDMTEGVIALPVREGYIPNSVGFNSGKIADDIAASNDI